MEPRWTEDHIRKMPLRNLMSIVASATEAELRVILNSRVNVLVHQSAIQRLEAMAAQRGSRTSAFQARLAITIALIALLVAVASWLGWRPF